MNCYRRFIGNLFKKSNEQNEVIDLVFKSKIDTSQIKKTDLIAFLGTNTSFDDYIAQYRLAINTLVVNLEKRKIIHFNVIALPTLFLIRHIFELTAKRDILFLQNYLSVQLPALELNTESHKISKLTVYHIRYLKQVEDILTGKGKKIIRDYIRSITKLSGLLEVIDNDSYALRYHIDNTFSLNFNHDYQINCKELLTTYFLYLDLSDKTSFYTDGLFNQ